jgi:hypothetical protein
MRFRFLQQGKDLLPLHTGKTFEKVCNAVTGLQMVKQTLNRYPGPGKDRLAPENFRVPRNDFLPPWIGIAMLLHQPTIRGASRDRRAFSGGFRTETGCTTDD